MNKKQIGTEKPSVDNAFEEKAIYADDANTDTKMEVTKSSPKKETPKKEESKKESTKKDTPKKDEKKSKTAAAKPAHKPAGKIPDKSLESMNPKEYKKWNGDKPRIPLAILKFLRGVDDTEPKISTSHYYSKELERSIADGNLTSKVMKHSLVIKMLDKKKR